MPCTEGISKAITSNCSTTRIGGLGVEAYIFNVDDVTVTYDSTNPSLITNLVNLAAKKAYKITGVKKLLNAGSEVVVNESRPNMYKHKFNFEQFECTAADWENITDMDNIFVVVESKQRQSANGTFMAYGVKGGMYKAADSHMHNENDGVRTLEYASYEAQGEPHAAYMVHLTSYALTKSLLEGCLVVPA